MKRGGRYEEDAGACCKGLSGHGVVCPALRFTHIKAKRWVVGTGHSRGVQLLDVGRARHEQTAANEWKWVKIF